MDIDKILHDVLAKKIDTSCCPEVDEALKKYEKGEATLEQLKEAIRKQAEAMD